MQTLCKLIGFTLLISVVGILAACNKANDPSNMSDLRQSIASIEHPAKDHWIERCANCHGLDGRGNQALAAPAVNGLPSWYSARQLRHFRDGVRGAHPKDTHGQAMALAVANIDQTKLMAMAELMTQLPPDPPAATLQGDLARGKDYQNNLCSACHGTHGQGNRLLHAPPLNTLNDWYIVGQYEKFRVGIRGSHPEDTIGAQMLRFAPAVEAKVVPDIAHFVTRSQGS